MILSRSKIVVAGLVLLFGVQTLAFDHKHPLLAEVLQKYVRTNGPKSTFNYFHLKADSAVLDKYLSQVESVEKKEYSSWSEKEKLAFLINAYNAFTLKLIIDHYPVPSIREIKPSGIFGMFKSPWKIEFFKLFGKPAHLDLIEHEIIRKQFDEPRIHFSLVCASKGCPALLDQPFVPDTLEAQLESRAKAFLKDKDRNRYNKAKNQLELSSLFKWYGEDFDKKYRGYKEFVMTRMNLTGEAIELLRSNGLPVEFLDYDWSLNEHKR